MGDRAEGLICLRTGKVALRGSESLVDVVDPQWVPLIEGEPYFTQNVRSRAVAHERTDDGRFDRSHLSPENAWRIGRDYLAHCIRYGFPMKIVKEHFGPGVRILEMGCGKEIPLFRTLTCDHSATTYYKPSLYVAADLNKIKYRPKVNGIETIILPETNIVEQPEKVPDDKIFDLVVSFEVLEHMDKRPDGDRFLDSMVSFARRKVDAEGKPGMILLSTPVNGGHIAKNHIYEWQMSELERAWIKRGCKVLAKYGTFANLYDLVPVLTDAERECWNQLAEYHAPHTLSCLFSANHPEVARNIAWKVEVPA